MESPSRPLRIYSDCELGGAQTCALLAPFWGRNEGHPTDPYYGRYDHYQKIAGSLFELTDRQRAEFAVLPFDYSHVLTGRRHYSEVETFIQQVADAGKKTIVFFWHDTSDPVDLPESHTIIIRTAVDRSRRLGNEWVYPTFQEDFVEKYFANNLPLREFTPHPMVSFRGRAIPKTNLVQTLRSSLRDVRDNITGRPRGYPYGRLRNRAMAILERNRDVDCRFTTFEKFFGGLGDDAGHADPSLRAEARREYVRSLLECDYVLCVRGAGNFSMRLYETLCMGRIPLIIDTDSVFPCENSLRWEELGVIVPERNLPSLAKRLVDFHRSLSPAEFVQLQQNCRAAWLSHLSPHGFFSTLSMSLLSGRMS